MRAAVSPSSRRHSRRDSGTILLQPGGFAAELPPDAGTAATQKSFAAIGQLCSKISFRHRRYRAALSWCKYYALTSRRDEAETCTNDEGGVELGWRKHETLRKKSLLQSANASFHGKPHAICLRL